MSDCHYKTFLQNFFKKYLNDFCLQSTNEESLFWSCNNRILKQIPTTTNSLEAWHRSINSKTGVHPNILKFIIMLQKEELKMSIKIEQLKNGKFLTKRGVYEIQMYTICCNYEFYDGLEFIETIIKNTFMKFE
jgi:hypothetical protein